MDNASRKSMVNLSASSKTSLTVDAKDKPRMPIIRDRSAPSSTAGRRVTIIGQSGMNVERSKLKPLEDRYRRAITKRRKNRNLCSFFVSIYIVCFIDSVEAPGDDIDSDGSELSSASKMSSMSVLSTQSERPGIMRKPRY